MKKADDIIIQKLLEMCKYIKWTNVESFEDLDKNKNKEQA